MHSPDDQIKNLKRNLSPTGWRSVQSLRDEVTKFLRGKNMNQFQWRE